MAEPPITLRAIHDSGPLAMPINRIVIHATCPTIGYPAASAAGQAMATARYFQTAAAGGSAHYVCDVATETHCVPDNVVSWHAPPNDHSIGIEICAEGGAYGMSYTRDQWLSPQVWPAVQRAAARTAELCTRFGLPVVKLNAADLLAGKRGICAHVDVSTAWKQSTHSDLGKAFPWPEFLAAVEAAGTPTPAPDPEETELMAAKDDIINALCADNSPIVARLIQIINRGGQWQMITDGTRTAVFSGDKFIELPAEKDSDLPYIARRVNFAVAQGVNSREYDGTRELCALLAKATAA